MKQYPSRLKFKKNHKLSKSYFELQENKMFYPKDGLFAIKISQPCKLTFPQIEACRKSVKRNIKKSGTIKINTFTYFSKTSKGLGVRMGKGKGSHSVWLCPVKSGHVVCEISGGLSIYKSIKALQSAATRLPCKAHVIKLSY
jgi:large subunit ribosomal protein L16